MPRWLRRPIVHRLHRHRCSTAHRHHSLGPHRLQWPLWRLDRPTQRHHRSRPWGPQSVPHFRPNNPECLTAWSCLSSPHGHRHHYRCSKSPCHHSPDLCHRPESLPLLDVPRLWCHHSLWRARFRVLRPDHRSHRRPMPRSFRALLSTPPMAGTPTAMAMNSATPTKTETASGP